MPVRDDNIFHGGRIVGGQRHGEVGIWSAGDVLFDAKQQSGRFEIQSDDK
jgi:hypothetical protein